MTSEHVINLLGGLALFIFGMTFMSDGLKKLAGDYMKTILEKLTEKRIMAVLLSAPCKAPRPASPGSRTRYPAVRNLRRGLLSRSRPTVPRPCRARRPAKYKAPPKRGTAPAQRISVQVTGSGRHRPRRPQRRRRVFVC